MAVVSTERQATLAEIVAEMDRRGSVIEALEREIREVRQSNSELYRRAVDAESELRRATPTPPAGDALREAAERVVWFDWSDNDSDAVAAISALRATLHPATTGGGES